jgi:hypothetical protein
LSQKEREKRMEELRLQAIMGTNLHNATKAIQELAAFGNEAIPELLKISSITSLADDAVKRAANLEIEKIRKGLKS